jgi:hypothetical protein
MFPLIWLIWVLLSLVCFAEEEAKPCKKDRQAFVSFPNLERRSGLLLTV